VIYSELYSIEKSWLDAVDNDNIITDTITDTNTITDIITNTNTDTNSNKYNDILDMYRDEIASLRGTPELVDRLENLVAKYPGIELCMDLYRAIYPFPLDKFQEDGLSSLINGNNVLVATPTGSGKTLVGELAIYFALMMGLRVAYTTPLKALSNQKFQDFTKKYGGDRVGLLTGDIVINRGARVTVMTTEVFRNMIYDQDSDMQLSNLFMVCFDEFHFMNDPDRGTVWEESVISCPSSVRILALSATMGNVADIQGWMSSIHGKTDLVLSDHRPVPLRYLFAMKQGLLPLFRDPNAGPGSRNGLIKIQGKLGPGSNVNPSIMKLEEQAVKQAQQRMSRQGRPLKSKPKTDHLIPKYSDMVSELQSQNLLPAIVFIFSRVGCETSAKMLVGDKLKLLTPDETDYVKQAISQFCRQNPEIPISKASIQLLKSGVGVHHAGLIPVWKAFIEDLFNANKIKVLFATETLAAGVNMPARTTIITTVTKKMNSEIVKLKTSQMLQMAGRAGRRGKDTEGTVVIMRNRFEEVNVGHKIITSNIDGIKSHFKTSYGLTVKLLQTKSIDECKALIERGFGSYLLQKKIVKKENDMKVEVEIYRNLLQKYTLKGARDYLKLARRLEKEKKNYEFLVEKMRETDNDLVQAIADYMPLGIGLQLQNGVTGFFLGDVKYGDRDNKSGFGVITRSNQLLVVKKEHVSAFAEAEDSIPSKQARDLLDLFLVITEWDEKYMESSVKPLLEASIPNKVLENDPKIASAIHAVQISKPFPNQKLPGSIIKQDLVLKELVAEMDQNPVHIAGDGDGLIEALRYAASLKDPSEFVNGLSDTQANKNEKEVFAWRMFLNVIKILQQFEALVDTKATELGEMVSSISADNELWLAIVLRHESVQKLNAAELGAVVLGVVVDGYKASQAYVKNKPSENVQYVFNALEPLSWDLKLAQTEAGIDFPVHLSREAGGLVESWINGTSWRDLCKETSLDQGDLCRMLRRTVEVLRQIPQASCIPENIVQLAYDAAKGMDRFPVADLDSEQVTRPSAGVGFGAMGDNAASDAEQLDLDFLFSDDNVDIDDINEGGDDDDIISKVAVGKRRREINLDDDDIFGDIDDLEKSTTLDGSTILDDLLEDLEKSKRQTPFEVEESEIKQKFQKSKRKDRN